VDHVAKKRNSVTITWQIGEAGKGIHEHFMIKEIKEQPSVIRQALMQDSRLINRMAMISCGSTR
jgi:glucosamine 6-phosphate synthetase-like amidotransferase/phosphosugar isomerase protein